MIKHHNKLTSQERDRIAFLKAKGISLRGIAKNIGRSISTISEELKRNSSFEAGELVYEAISAQEEYEKRKSKAGKRVSLKNKQIYQYVIEKLRDGWSPEQISGRLKRNHPHDKSWWISYETIYQYIFNPDNADETLWEYLPRHRKKRRKKGGRRVHKGKIPDRVSIHLRPKIIDNRKVFGHFEGDTVEGKGHRDGFHTEVERLSRVIFAVKVKSITSEEGLSAQKQIFSDLPKQARKSTTLDNGRENHMHKTLEKELGVRTYFADPYSSWQRGTNENSNGLIRRYFPKKTDLSQVTQEELDEVLLEINNRPRKVLKYQTPLEVFTYHLSKCSE